MPAVTIDLVSSSPPAIAKKSPKISKPTVTIRPSSSKAPSRKNDDYLTLSDDDGDPFASSPSNATIPFTFPSSKPNPQPKKNAKEQDDILLSKDSGSSRTSKAKPKQTINQKYDFYLLSDDFDSTINLDKSLADNEPSTKKRRLSSSPEPSLPKPATARDFTRSISNIESSKSKPPQKRVAQPMKRSKTAGPVLESDPLVFTSSPDPFEPKRNKKNRARLETVVDDEDEFGDMYFDDELPDIAEFSSAAPRSQKGARSALQKYKESREAERTEKPVPKAKAKASGSKSKSSNDLTAEEKAGEKEAKARERTEAKEKRDAVKVAEKEEKRLAKEQQARDKVFAVELAKVNTIKTDKKVSTPEMIIQLSASIDPTLTAQINKLAQGISVDVEEFASLQPLVKWKRKVESRYNDELGYWEKIPKQVKQEEHVLCMMKATEFVELSLGDEGTDLDAHALKIKAQHPTFQIIYLIEGITSWMKKNKNTKKNQFDAAVRSYAEAPEEPTASGRPRKKKKKAAEYVDEDMIEDALLRLQVAHGMLIHHVDLGVQSAEWVTIFTQYISTIPYKHQQESHNASFCMESGQIKCGDDTPDTFNKMLQQMVRVTPGISQAIVSEYKTVQALVEAFNEKGPGAVKDLCKATNKDGGYTNRVIGPAISKRLHAVFTGRDPTAFDT